MKIDSYLCYLAIRELELICHFSTKNGVSIFKSGGKEYNAINILKQLANEYFNPQPLKFEEIKIDMYVWDNEYKSIGKVEEILTNCDLQRLHVRYNGSGDIVYYENDRFYPIKIPIL